MPCDLFNQVFSQEAGKTLKGQMFNRIWRARSTVRGQARRFASTFVAN